MTQPQILTNIIQLDYILKLGYTNNMNRLKGYQEKEIHVKRNKLKKLLETPKYALPENQ